MSLTLEVIKLINFWFFQEVAPAKLFILLKKTFPKFSFQDIIVFVISSADFSIDQLIVQRFFPRHDKIFLPAVFSRFL